ncbi:c-type cytochrome [Maribacter chungangensis]|uniref:C-type cytochrome n=1 Tax=Maribacter chungangensis TaxID=1069117 RepID=A0ABW3B5E6_9FLAO
MKLFIFIYCCAVVFFSISLFQDAELKQRMERGKAVYNDFCISCHLPQGEGVPYTFPPLANSDYLMQNREKSIKAIKYGLQGEITVNGIKYNSSMAGLGLEDEEVADVMNYISNSWGNTSDAIVTTEEVAKIKK